MTSTGIQLGMFYADPDVQIANRIQEKFKKIGHELKLCDFYQAGLPKMEIIEQFLKENNAGFWLATAAAVTDEAIMKSTRDIGLYEGITNKSFRFIVLQPREYLKLPLPTILKAYTPLSEDEFFEKRIKSTLQSIEKHVLKPKTCSSHQSSSTSGISTSSNADLSTAPVSDVTKDDSATEEGELNMVISGPGINSQSAVPIPQPTPQPVVENEENAAPPAVYNIHITGANSTVQIGSGNQQIFDGNQQ
ncbi:uncharacterized protein LOC120333959 [Styela clava]